MWSIFAWTSVATGKFKTRHIFHSVNLFSRLPLPPRRSQLSSESYRVKGLLSLLISVNFWDSKVSHSFNTWWRSFSFSHFNHNKAFPVMWILKCTTSCPHKLPRSLLGKSFHCFLQSRWLTASEWKSCSVWLLPEAFHSAYSSVCCTCSHLTFLSWQSWCGTNISKFSSTQLSGKRRGSQEAEILRCHFVWRKQTVEEQWLDIAMRNRSVFLSVCVCVPWVSRVVHQEKWHHVWGQGSHH